MSSFQRVIKYCAIAFAILLAVGIISGIVQVAVAVVSVVSGNTFTVRNEKTVDYEEAFENVRSINIDIATGDLTIKTGDTFRVEAVNVTNGFKAKMSGNGTLLIDENHNNLRFFWFNLNGIYNPNSKITVYLPADFVAKRADINCGAGKVTIEKLQADDLVISAGAGNINGSELTAKEVKIDGGVGNVDLEKVQFEDADFNCGVGNLRVEGSLLGDNKIDCGVGEVNLELQGNEEDYDLDIDAGIGTIRLNGEKISKGTRRNSDAENSIKIDGGVGSVKINFTGTNF
jgi:DUF4097 and DUF4098 domain-containing protein YvlB